MIVLRLGLDTALQPNQGLNHVPFIEELLSFATGKDSEGRTLLTIKDLSKILGKRRVQAKKTNKEYSLARIHKLFGNGK